MQVQSVSLTQVRSKARAGGRWTSPEKVRIGGNGPLEKRHRQCVTGCRLKWLDTGGRLVQ